MGFFTKKEKAAFRQGLLAGLSKRKKRKSNKVKSNKKSQKSELMEYHRRYRERNLGALLFNGKIYDNNFKDGPREITKKEIQDMRSEYVPDGAKWSDLDVADAYVRDMRRKCGVYDKTGKWLGLLTDVK